AGLILDEEQLVFLANPRVLDGEAVQSIIQNNATFHTEDLDTYDSNYDDVLNAKVVLMANISNYGFDVISELHRLEPLDLQEIRVALHLKLVQLPELQL
nr:hypothetical protein [Tanacetum cinerariifolium]